MRTNLEKYTDTEATELFERCSPDFSTEHDDPLKNEIAAQLNAVLGRTHFITGDPFPDDTDVEFARAALAREHPELR
jgi:hypothetical protein